MKKKLEINAKTIATAIGAVVTLGSVIAIADFIDRKARAKTAHTAELVIGIAGVLAGTAMTIGANRPPRHKIIVEDMFDDDDELELAHEQIRETLNMGADRGVFTSECEETVEVDEEATAEDFI